MSRALDRIAFYWLNKGDSGFLTPAHMLTEEDMDLVKAGVFKLSTEELHAIRCPFGCGEFEDIQILEDDDGRTIHYLACTNGPDEMELVPKDYQLYAFDSVAYERYRGGLEGLIKNKRVRKGKRPRNTKWILFERKTVLEYANDPKRNRSGKQPWEVCETVWRINKEIFENAANLPKGEAGYSNCESLKTYFYNHRKREFVQKYRIEIHDDEE